MLKKVALFILIAVCALSSVFSASAATINLKIDGKTVASDVAPFLDETGTTLVPLRVISETLGADVSWNQSSKKATVKTAAYTAVFTIDSKTFTVNGETKTLIGSAKLINERTMVPIRAFSEAIGAKVNYDAAANTASVDYFTTITGTIKISGSTTVQPIAQKAADKLIAANKGLSITVAGGGSGAGIKDATGGTVNVGMSSRDLTADEKAV
ncbi:MAG: stalk domain-containing protein, partial [Sedimentibacter sp.]